jgi:general secretion pathway protein M
MSGPRAWLSRGLAVSLLAGLLAVAYLVGINPLLTAYHANEAAIAEAQRLVRRFNAMAVGEDDLQVRVRELAELHASEPYYLTKETDALAAVEMQNRVQVAVNENGGTIRSIQPLRAEKEGDFQRVTLRIQITATIGSLFGVIHALETTQPFLFLDNVDIKSRQSRASAEGQVTEPTLTVTLELYGYQPPEAL